MQFVVCHSLFILLKAKRKTILSAGSLDGTSSWPESLLFSAATAPPAAAGSTSRLWNWGRRVICASWGFSFFVRRDFSVQWGHAVCLGVGPWLGCGRQGLRDVMLCWRLLACCLVLSQAKQTENRDFWSFENPGRRDQTDSPNFFLITVSVFYWRMLRKYETISGGDIDFVLRYQLIFLSLIKVYNITLSFVQQRFFDTVKKWVSQSLGYLLLLMSTDKITLFWIKLYSGSYHVTNNCY